MNSFSKENMNVFLVYILNDIKHALGKCLSELAKEPDNLLLFLCYLTWQLQIISLDLNTGSLTLSVKISILIIVINPWIINFIKKRRVAGNQYRKTCKIFNFKSQSYIGCLCVYK